MVLSLSVLLFAAQSLPALGNREGPQKIEATGRVRLVGNSPRSSLVITGKDREWHIDYREQEKFMELQHQTVTVMAEEFYHDMFFVNGFPAGRRYFLRNIVVVRVGD